MLNKGSWGTICSLTNVILYWAHPDQFLAARQTLLELVEEGEKDRGIQAFCGMWQTVFDEVELLSASPVMTAHSRETPGYLYKMIVGVENEDPDAASPVLEVKDLKARFAFPSGSCLVLANWLPYGLSGAREKLMVFKQQMAKQERLRTSGEMPMGLSRWEDASGICAHELEEEISTVHTERLYPHDD